ncbi:hypothetical protein G7Z17_g13083 [Cylindrodendrum hubeiense]|uniref:Uncharacterized protein n=1 Tax=Cylindrodendrum hubeiense TaxID=595255 RepID=A0A9P5L9M9_9HYPO|nr:hypothetical protein G7Z17_g13083 [Cylindrodendrum hubeiense]
MPPAQDHMPMPQGPSSIAAKYIIVLQRTLVLCPRDQSTLRPPQAQNPRAPRSPLLSQTSEPCAALLPNAPSIWVSPGRSVYVRPGKETHSVLVQMRKGMGVADEDLSTLAPLELPGPYWQALDEAFNARAASVVMRCESGNVKAVARFYEQPRWRPRSLARLSTPQAPARPAPPKNPPSPGGHTPFVRLGTLETLETGLETLKGLKSSSLPGTHYFPNFPRDVSTDLDGTTRASGCRVISCVVRSMYCCKDDNSGDQNH